MATVPQIDFSPIGSLADVYRSAQQNERKRAALERFAQTGDSTALAASGDPTLANMHLQYVQRKAQAERQAQLDARQLERDKVLDTRADRQFAQQQAYQNRSLGLQEAQLREKPSIQKVKDAAGNETLVQAFPDGRTRVLTPSEAAAAGGGPNNPFAPSGKQTEGQANASLYARRMFQAEKVLRDPKVEGAASSATERGLAMLPGAGRFYNPNSVEFQKFDQAQRDFINATLRRESGAVISEQEFENARKQYFPAPGDSKEVIVQKRRNRAEAIKGIAGAAGPAYRAPATFDDVGNLQDRSAPARTTGPTGPTSQIPPAAIEALRANPDLKADFEAKYGPGTAGVVLR